MWEENAASAYENLLLLLIPDRILCSVLFFLFFLFFLLFSMFFDGFSRKRRRGRRRGRRRRGRRMRARRMGSPRILCSVLFFLFFLFFFCFFCYFQCFLMVFRERGVWQELRKHLGQRSQRVNSKTVTNRVRSAQWHYWNRGKDLWLEAGRMLTSLRGGQWRGCCSVGKRLACIVTCVYRKVRSALPSQVFLLWKAALT